MPVARWFRVRDLVVGEDLCQAGVGEVGGEAAGCAGRRGAGEGGGEEGGCEG